MHEQLRHRRVAVSGSVVIGPADAPQFPDLQTPAMRRGAAHRPKSGNAATPHTALRGRHGAVHSYGRNSGARLIRALLIVCQILLGALPALLSVSPSAAQTVETVPSEPQNLSATPGDGAVALNWQAPASDGGAAVDRYEYRHAEGASVPSATAWASAGAAFNATVGSLTNGTAYAFEVRAVSDAGAGGPATAAATPATVPSAPQNLTATPGDGRVTLNWQAPADDGGSVIHPYVYRYAEGTSVPIGTPWEFLDDGLTVTIENLTNGTAYAFEVRAVNRMGIGDVATATTIPATQATVPSEPQNLSATPGDGAVALNWQAPASDGGAELTGYEYRFAEGAAVPATTVWNYAGTSLTVTVGSLTNGTAYAFEVRTANRVGVSDAAETRATPAAAATAPSEPQNLSATPGHGEVMLTWEAPASDGGSAVTGYEYRYAAGTAVPTETAWHSAGMDLRVTVGGLTNGTAYAFEVRAVSDAGASDAAAATATPAAAATAPSAPQTVSATPGDGAVALTWEAPASAGASAVTGYEYRYAEGAGVPTETPWTSAGMDLRVTVGGLTNGTAYAFEVRAVSDAGASDAAAATAPSVPQTVSATPGDGEVTLTWEAPANDGGSAVTGYEYRYAAGTAVPTETAWHSAGMDLRVTVGGLTNGTAYAFEVRAVSDAGASDAAAATATPAAAATAPSVPQTVSATPGDGEVTLTWEAPANDGGSAVTGYEYRYAAGTAVPTETVWHSAGTSLTATIASLTNGTAYAFEVRAVNDVGEGDPVTATAAPAAPATAPSAPQNLAAAPGDRKVTLGWEPPTTDGGTAIDRYEYRYINGSAVQSGAATSRALQAGARQAGTPQWVSVGIDRAVTVNSLKNGAQYAFDVRAVNGVGPGPVARVTVTPAIAPDAPRDLRAIPGDRKVTLEWKPPANDGGSPVRLYLYRHAEGASVPAGTQWDSVQDALTVTIGNLTNGTQYAFEVRAVSSGGASDTATATAIPFAPPSVAELQRHIAGFMLNRANTLANNQPRLTRFLKNGKAGNSLAGQVTGHSGEARGSLHLQDVLLDVATAWSDSNGARSRYLFGALGGHWRLDERLLAGLMLQVDLSDGTLPGRNGSVGGTGWLAGPYFAAQLDGQPLYFEGRLLHGQTDNRLVHATGVTGAFGTERWLAQVRIEGDVELDAGLRLTPFADLLSTRDRQLRFTDSLGRLVGGQAVSLGQAKAGIDFRLPIPANDGALALTGGVAGAYSETGGGGADAGFAGGRARVDLGFDYRLGDAVGIELKGYYDGIGTPNYGSYGLDGSLKIRF